MELSTIRKESGPHRHRTERRKVRRFCWIPILFSVHQHISEAHRDVIGTCAVRHTESALSRTASAEGPDVPGNDMRRARRLPGVLLRHRVVEPHELVWAEPAQDGV